MAQSDTNYNVIDEESSSVEESRGGDTRGLDPGLGLTSFEGSLHSWSVFNTLGVNLQARNMKTIVTVIIIPANMKNSEACSVNILASATAMTMI